MPLLNPLDTFTTKRSSPSGILRQLPQHRFEAYRIDLHDRDTGVSLPVLWRDVAEADTARCHALHRDGSVISDPEAVDDDVSSSHLGPEFIARETRDAPIRDEALPFEQAAHLVHTT